MSRREVVYLLTSASGDNIYLAEQDIDPFGTWDARWKVVRCDRLPCDGRMRQFVGYADYLDSAHALARRNLARMQEKS